MGKPGYSFFPYIWGTPYATAWRILRAGLIDYHNRKCMICWAKGQKFHIHHRDGNPCNNHFRNLKVLCASCHKKVHGIKDDYGPWGQPTNVPYKGDRLLEEWKRLKRHWARKRRLDK